MEGEHKEKFRYKVAHDKEAAKNVILLIEDLNAIVIKKDELTMEVLLDT